MSSGISACNTHTASNREQIVYLLLELHPAVMLAIPVLDHLLRNLLRGDTVIQTENDRTTAQQQ